MAFAILIALGVWQIERKAWKENLIATVAQRMATPPSALPPEREWANLMLPRTNFAAFQFRAQLDRDDEARVYTGGGGLRDDVKAPGYFAFAPARPMTAPSWSIAAMSTIPIPTLALEPIAVPNDGDRDCRRVALAGAAGLVRHALFGAAEPVVRARPPCDRYGGALNCAWSSVAPFYIEMESPAPPGGVPRPGVLTVKLRNDHLGYALTWFGLAAMLLGVFGFWAVRRR